MGRFRKPVGEGDAHPNQGHEEESERISGFEAKCVSELGGVGDGIGSVEVVEERERA